MHHTRPRIRRRLSILGVAGLLALAAAVAPVAQAAPSVCSTSTGVVLTTNAGAGAVRSATLTNCGPSAATVRFVVGILPKTCRTLAAGAAATHILSAGERKKRATVTWATCDGTTPAVPGPWNDFLSAPNTNLAVCSTSTTVGGMSDKSYDGPYLVGAGTSHVFNCSSAPVRVQADMTATDLAAGESGSYLTACTTVAPKSLVTYAKTVTSSHADSPTAWRTC